MKKIVLIFMLLFSTVAMAGNGLGDNDGDSKKLKTYSISGKVLDRQGELTGVTVMIDDCATTVYTDMEGNFTINNVVEGAHVIRFNMLSYEEKQVKINADGSNFDLVVEMYGR